MEIKYNLFKMVDFGEAIWKMDKWASEDSGDMQTFYDIVDDEALTFDEKVVDMEEFLDILIWDEERLHSYIDGNFNYKELANELVSRNI